MLKSIKVSSKRRAESMDLAGHKVISILDPNDYAELKLDEQHILRLNFDDVEEDDYEFDRMLPVQGKAILDFVYKVLALPEGYDLLIHCHAGLSRSVSIAIAIKEILDFSGPLHWYKQELDLDWITDSVLPLVKLPDIAPNKHVYKTVLGSHDQLYSDTL